MPPKNKDKKANTSRMNKLEELGRVDAEKGKTSKGKRNLKDEKKRIIKELSPAKTGGAKKSHASRMTPEQHKKFKQAVKDGVITKGQHDKLSAGLLEAIIKKKKTAKK